MLLSRNRCQYNPTLRAVFLNDIPIHCQWHCENEARLCSIQAEIEMNRKNIKIISVFAFVIAWNPKFVESNWLDLLGCGFNGNWQFPISITSVEMSSDRLMCSKNVRYWISRPSSKWLGEIQVKIKSRVATKSVYSRE